MKKAMRAAAVHAFDKPLTIEALAFAEQAKVAATVTPDRLVNIAGRIEGRIVLDMSA